MLRVLITGALKVLRRTVDWSWSRNTETQEKPRKPEVCLIPALLITTGVRTSSPTSLTLLTFIIIIISIIIITSCYKRSWDTSLGIGTRLCVECSGFDFRLGVSGFSFSHKSRPSLGPTQPSDSFTGGKTAGS